MLFLSQEAPWNCETRCLAGDTKKTEKFELRRELRTPKQYQTHRHLYASDVCEPSRDGMCVPFSRGKIPVTQQSSWRDCVSNVSSFKRETTAKQCATSCRPVATIGWIGCRPLSSVNGEPRPCTTSSLISGRLVHRLIRFAAVSFLPLAFEVPIAS